MYTPPRDLERDLLTVLNLLNFSEHIDTANRKGFGSAENIYDAIKILNVYKLAGSQIKTLDKHFKDVANDRVFVSNEAAANNVRVNLNIIKDILRNAIVSLRIATPEESANSINVTFPSKMNDLKELSESSSKLSDAVVFLVQHPDINSFSRVESVSNGSVIFNIALESAAAVAVVAGAVSAALKVKNQQLQNQFASEKIRALGIQNDVMETIAKKIEEEVKTSTQQEAEILAGKHYSTVDHEQIERTKLSIRYFTELLMKGTQISASINAPKETTTLFPDPKNFLSGATEQKELDQASKN